MQDNPTAFAGWATASANGGIAVDEVAERYRSRIEIQREPAIKRGGLAVGSTAIVAAVKACIDRADPREVCVRAEFQRIADGRRDARKRRVRVERKAHQFGDRARVVERIVENIRIADATSQREKERSGRAACPPKLTVKAFVPALWFSPTVPSALRTMAALAEVAATASPRAAVASASFITRRMLIPFVAPGLLSPIQRRSSRSAVKCMIRRIKFLLNAEATGCKQREFVGWRKPSRLGPPLLVEVVDKKRPGKTARPLFVKEIAF